LRSNEYFINAILLDGHSKSVFSIPQDITPLLDQSFKSILIAKNLVLALKMSFKLHIFHLF